ncbi:MAG: ester cyclase, partial [Acidimicrobiia bacterium]
FNTADWDRLRANAAPDIVYEEAGTGRRLQGVDDYLVMAQGWRQAFSDVTGEVVNLVSSGGTVAVEVNWTGTHDGPLVTPAAEIPATGKPISIAATLWYEIEGDRVQNLRNHLDLLGMLNQLGVLPN